jgi:iron(II)-dependent oxidoreductase
MDSATNLNTKAGLRALLPAARKYTLAIYGHLTPAQLQVPQLAIVNPPLWELAHIAWFQEFWCRRARPGRAPLPSRYAHFDAWYNSSVILHAARWALPHPSYDAILRHMEDTLEDTLQALERADPGALYFFGLSALHEAMHTEALLMTLQTLALPAPPLLDTAAPDASMADGVAVAARDIAYAGGTFLMGAQPGASGFVFDNEKWAHPATVAPFAIANVCVSNAEFARFVEDGGYARSAWWSEAGRVWLDASSARHPVYWRRDGADWLTRRNDRWEPLAAAQPALHVNFHEAQAYCAWAQRRLPSEAEWEFAARAGGGPACFPWGDDPAWLRDCALEARCGRPLAVGRSAARLGPLAHMLGNVWEWTATRFEPYPGFAADPYVDYSAPWFGNHMVLRGGSFVSAPCLIHNRFRNFYRPERSDMFVGFRTCALD